MSTWEEHLISYTIVYLVLDRNMLHHLTCAKKLLNGHKYVEPNNWV